MSVQKAFLPGMVAAIGLFLGMVSLLRTGAHYSTPVEETVAQQAALALAPVIQAAPVEPSLSATQVSLAGWDGSCTIAGSYPDSIRQWCQLIERYARENGLDPNLVSAVMLQESNGHPDAYSKSGAVGLLQVMPRDGLASKFQCKNGPCFSDRPSMEELFDPEFNVAYGARMLAQLIQSQGSVRDALKAYGPKDVDYYYADLVLNIVNTYR